MNLHAGYGEWTITPPLGIELTGYGYFLERRAESVLDDLKIRAIFLKKDSSRLLLISCDLLAFSVPTTDELRTRLAAEFEMPFENILISCTHTHSGPAAAPARGLGEMDADYVATLPDAMLNAAKAAHSDLTVAEVFHHSEVLEPIGFNRRKGNFDPIDPVLKIVRFKREGKELYLLNYSCHPVALCQGKRLSADWPGRVVSQMELRGARAVFFQGCLGDINPVSRKNRAELSCPDEDLNLPGQIAATRALKTEQYGKPSADGPLLALERRIQIPLNIPSEQQIIEEAERMTQLHAKALQYGGRFYAEWKEEALTRRPALVEDPFCKNVPIHALRIGDIRIIGIPGEVFCEYGITLAREFFPLVPVGLAGGVVGYIPTKEAYQHEGDYGCYSACRFYGNTFPFTDEIEEIVLGECREILHKIQ